MENKSVKVILIILILSIVSIFSYLFLFKKSVNNIEIDNSFLDVEDKKVIQNDNLDSNSKLEEMYLYTNEKHGFSLQVPKQIMFFSNSCGDKFVPTKTFEKDNNVYITYQYLFEYNAETGVCEEKTIDVDMIDDSRWNLYSWKFTIKDVKNDNELDSFLKENYGNTCNFSNRLLSAQSGVFDIVLEGDGKDPAESNCWVKSMVAIKYYPEKNKLIFWNLGQEPSFWRFNPINADPALDPTYDDEMLSSFRFLE